MEVNNDAKFEEIRAKTIKFIQTDFLQLEPIACPSTPVLNCMHSFLSLLSNQVIKKDWNVKKSINCLSFLYPTRQNSLPSFI